MRTIFCMVAGALLSVFASAAGAVDVPDGFIVYKVGGGADCPYHAIQDAIDAAAQHPGIDLVWIANDQLYQNQHVVITDQDVNVQGGFSDCEDNDPGLDLTVINGTSGHSVFEIEGTSNVFITNLEITGASMDSSHKGGGIYFGGQGSLGLEYSWVFANQAGQGGGIDVSPSGPTTVDLIQTVVSLNNALVDGGGIRVEGETTLNILHSPADANSFITTNAAQGSDGIGYGGGIEVLGPAVANISAFVDANTAPYGGGIAVLGTDGGSAMLNLFAGDPNVAVTISDNTAWNTGGGIFLKSHSDDFATAKMCAQDFAIDANSATNGSAIYADEDGGMGSIAFLNQVVCDPPPGAVPCAAGVACNEIDDNVASTDGTVLIQSGGTFAASRFSARRNSADYLFWFVNDAAAVNGGDFLDLHNCLLVDNSVNNILIFSGAGQTPGAGTEMTIDTCTIAGNHYRNDVFPLGGYVVDAVVNNLNISNSIIYDTEALGSLWFSGGAPADLTTRYVLTTDATGFIGGTGIVDGTPQFVDAANGDYHLVRTSPGVDFAPEIDGVDLDGNPRTIDLTDIADLYGPADIGAYEIQTQLQLPDVIFQATFDP